MTGNSSLSCCACWPHLRAEWALPGGCKHTQQGNLCGVAPTSWVREVVSRERTWPGSTGRLQETLKLNPYLLPRGFITSHPVLFPPNTLTQIFWIQMLIVMAEYYPFWCLTLSARCCQSLFRGYGVWLHITPCFSAI